MKRLTTPTIIFENLGIDTSLLDKIYVTLEQNLGNEKVKIEKSKEDLTIDSDSVEFRLAQEETALLSPYAKVKLELTATTLSGDRLTSDTFERDVEDVLKKEII